jgi:nitrite reductase/ring-hydroxylating ferredoxin subunit
VSVTDEIPAAEIPYARFGLPSLGFRNYWYPALEARLLLDKPREVTLLGENIVLFRDGKSLFALANRCPHRGAKLSQGKCHFPGSGTLSCPYHGWTFAGATGILAAALMEGPDAVIAGKVHVATYPVAERFGLIWLFIGDMAPVDLGADLPVMLQGDEFFTVTAVQDYRCNWRALADNWANDQHGPYVHRNSPELICQPFMRFAVDLDVVEGRDGRSIGVRGRNGTNRAFFPGLGAFPRRSWYRFLPPIGRGNRDKFEQSRAAQLFGFTTPTQTRLPGMVIVGRQSANYFLIQWAAPIDAERTRLFNINCFRRRGLWREAIDRAHYLLWRGWAHDRIFSDQDRHVIEGLSPGAERLSRSDTGVIAWRKFAASHARRPPAVKAAPAPESAEASLGA